MIKILSLLVIVVAFGSSRIDAQHRAKDMLDSLASLEVFPSDDVVIDHLNKISKVATLEEDFKTALTSLNYLSVYYDGGDDIHRMDSVVQLALIYARDTTIVNDVTLSSVLNNAAAVQDRKGNLQKANRLLLESIEVEKLKRGDHYELSLLYHNISSNYRLLGDYQSALSFSLKAKDAFQYIENQELMSDLLDEYYLTALNYQDLREYESAIAILKEGVSLSKDLHLQKSKSGSEQIIKLTYGVVENYLKLDKVDDAKLYLDKLKHLQTTTDYRKYKAIELEGVYHLKLGNYQESTGLLSKAIVEADKSNSGKNADLMKTELYRQLGDVFLKNEEWEKALASYDNGINLLPVESEGESSSPYLVNGETFNILTRKAELKQIMVSKEGLSQKALVDVSNDYIQIIKYLDKMKAAFVNEGSKYFIAGKANKIYGEAITIFQKTYDLTREEKYLDYVFTTMEKNKSGVLLENVKYKFNAATSSVPDAVLEKESVLKSKISYFSKVLAENKQDSKLSNIEKSAIQDSLFEVKENYNIFDNNIKKQYPSYGNLKQSLNVTSSTSDVQDYVDNDEMLIEYFTKDEELIIITISKREIMLESKIIPQLNKLIEQYKKALTTDPLSHVKTAASLEDISKTLAEAILPSKLNDIKDLIIIPDGQLGTFPFESLISNTGSYLIKDHLITYAYSADQLITADNSNINGASILAIAPIFGSKEAEENIEDISILSELPYAKAEAEYLHQSLDGTLISSDKTTPSDLLDNMRDFSIIHLATHASLNVADPMLSQIHFNTGSLTNYDIRDLNASPDLVVLSACNTGQGSIQKGEGIISLSRGFFEAGVKTLQSSLWAINDKSSYEIVASMYSHMKDGFSTAESLRQAKIDYIDRADKLRSHPYYWAGVVQIGQDNILFQKTYDTYYITFSLSLLVLGALIFIYRAKAQKTRR